jgi:hypothetical protein
MTEIIFFSQNIKIKTYESEKMHFLKDFSKKYAELRLG